MIEKRLMELEKENKQLKARIEHLERKIQRERTSAMKQHEKWEKEIQKENEQLKQQINELQFNKAKGQQEYQRRIFE